MSIGYMKYRYHRMSSDSKRDPDTSRKEELEKILQRSDEKVRTLFERERDDKPTDKQPQEDKT